MNKPDILIFMSDQHAAAYTGDAGSAAETKNIDRLAQDGTRFDNAFTPCPLCVPARMAFMSGRSASALNIFGNNDTLPDLTPTFLHPFVAAGYETVLAGRMHFVGQDQRHGFTRRIAPDMTPVTWTRPTEKLRAERGGFMGTFDEARCTEVVGGGESPVLHYDDAVIAAALDYLKKPHDKPQFLVVGVYGPHCPLVAPPELYKKYIDIVQPAETRELIPDYMNDVLLSRRQELTQEQNRACVAAYCGMIEKMDNQLGQVREAFDAFCRARGGEGIFVYLSDHGEQLGDRALYGKNSFFDKSVRVPMIFAGAGIQKNRAVREAVSLLDVGPTLCAMAGTDALPETEGRDLSPVLAGGQAPERVVVSELMEGWRTGNFHYARMATNGKYKWIGYHDAPDKEMLFDEESDREEIENLARDLPEQAAKLKQAALAQTGDADTLVKTQKMKMQYFKWFGAYEQATAPDDSERWQANPATARGELVYSSGKRDCGVK